jgi:hypothetical protein
MAKWAYGVIIEKGMDKLAIARLIKNAEKGYLRRTGQQATHISMPANTFPVEKVGIEVCGLVVSDYNAKPERAMYVHRKGEAPGL